MHEVLFERASQWSGRDDAADRFKAYAVELGLEASAFEACLDGGDTADAVQAQLDLSLSQGVSAVPAFYVNDWFVSGAQEFAVFQEVIGYAQEGQHPPPTPTPLPPGAGPFDANPDRPGYTYIGDVTLGSAEAEVVLLEFIDLGSPANGEFYDNVWPDVLAEFVDNGLVRVVVKHYPGSEPSTHFEAAVAAECAGRQDEFWEMHDLLLEQQGDWSSEAQVSAALERLAEQLGLDVAEFLICLDDEGLREKVSQDVAIAQRNQLESAPQFVLLYGEQATVVGEADLIEALQDLTAES
jgi:protein-disulfide isomerase